MHIYTYDHIIIIEYNLFHFLILLSMIFIASLRSDHFTTVWSLHFTTVWSLHYGLMAFVCVCVCARACVCFGGWVVFVLICFLFVLAMFCLSVHHGLVINSLRSCHFRFYHLFTTILSRHYSFSVLLRSRFYSHLTTTVLSVYYVLSCVVTSLRPAGYFTMVLSFTTF